MLAEFDKVPLRLEFFHIRIGYMGKITQNILNVRVVKRIVKTDVVAIQVALSVEGEIK